MAEGLYPSNRGRYSDNAPKGFPVAVVELRLLARATRDRSRTLSVETSVLFDAGSCNFTIATTGISRPPRPSPCSSELRSEVVSDRPIDLDAVELVAGVDVSVKNEQSQAAIVVMTYPGFLPVETVLAQRPTPFPYVPGLLSFREGPGAGGGVREAESRAGRVPLRRHGHRPSAPHRHRQPYGPVAAAPDHRLRQDAAAAAATRISARRRAPRRPSSTARRPSAWRCAPAPPRTRCSSRPATSPTFPRPAELVLRCSPKYRLPEPIRLAHNAAGQFSP